MSEKQHPPLDDCDLLIAWIEWSQKAMNRVENLTAQLLTADIEAKKAEARTKELEAKLANAFAIMEREIKRVQQIQQDFQTNPKKPPTVSLFSVQCEYEEILAEMKGDKP